MVPLLLFSWIQLYGFVLEFKRNCIVTYTVTNIVKRQCFYFLNNFLLVILAVCRPSAGQGGNEPFGALVGLEDSNDESYGNNSKDSTLMMREVRGRRHLLIASHDLLLSSSVICINFRQFLLHSLVSCVTVSFVGFFFLLVLQSAFFQHLWFFLWSQCWLAA